MLEPELKLWVNTDSTPYYWIDVTLPSGSGYEILSHGNVPEEDDPEDEIHVNVNMKVNANGNQTIQIDLGELPIDTSDGEIHIHLLDELTESQGGGVIATEEATEASKPIPSI